MLFLECMQHIFHQLQSCNMFQKKHVEKYANMLSCQELDEEIHNDLMSAW